MTDEQLAKDCAAAMYRNDVASQKLGIEIDNVVPGEAEACMTVRRDMLNGHGICHGGLIFTLADTAFAFACNTYGNVTVAAAADIDFVTPAKDGDRLRAIATEQHRGRRRGLYDVRVTNQDGDLIAIFRGRAHGREERLLPENDAS